MGGKFSVLHCTALRRKRQVQYGAEESAAQHNARNGTARDVLPKKRERKREEKKRRGAGETGTETNPTETKRNEETRREERRSRGAGDGDAEAKARRRGEERSGERRERLIAAPIKRSRYASARPPLVSVCDCLRAVRDVSGSGYSYEHSSGAVRHGSAQNPAAISGSTIVS